MKNISAKLAKLSLIAALLLTCQSHAWAVEYFMIKQGGWVGNGQVEGIFSGKDTNNDGFINLADGEVFSYVIKFSGNSFIKDFTHDLTDLRFFRYTIGSTGFRPSFPLFSENGINFYDADDHIIFETNFTNAIFTSEDALVKQFTPTVSQLCPCEGPFGTTDSWPNHGKYVSCVARTANDFRKSGLIDDVAKRTLVSSAAQSLCGGSKR